MREHKPEGRGVGGGREETDIDLALQWEWVKLVRPPLMLALVR